MAPLASALPSLQSPRRWTSRALAHWTSAAMRQYTRPLTLDNNQAHVRIVKVGANHIAFQTRRSSRRAVERSVDDGTEAVGKDSRDVHRGPWLTRVKRATWNVTLSKRVQFVNSRRAGRKRKAAAWPTATENAFDSKGIPRHSGL